MNNGFDKLCAEINFKKTNGFEDVKIIKADLNKDKVFEIDFSVNQIIPFIEMKNFLGTLNKNFKYKVKFNFEVASPVYEKEEIKFYINWILEEYLGNPSLAKIFLDNIKSIDPKGIIEIEPSSSYTNKQIIGVKESIERIMKRFGFKDFSLLINEVKGNNILEEEKNRILEDVAIQAERLKNQEKVVEIKQKTYGFVKNTIKDLQDSETYNRVSVEGTIFKKEIRETKSGMKIFLYTVHDNTEAIYLKSFASKEKDILHNDTINEGDDVLIKGSVQIDAYTQQKTITISSIQKVISSKDEEIDRHEKKRVELSFRTRMSTMDGIISPKEIVDKAIQWGHKAVAIIDNDSVQSFPEFEAETKGKDIKAIYGATFNLITENSNAVFNYKERNLANDEYVVFDLETTGLSPEYDEIIEFGAVIVKNNQITETKQFFMKPTGPLPEFTKELTGITEDDVKDAVTEKEGVQKIIDFIGDKTLVAHNANFDYTFIRTKAKKYGLENIENPAIDSLVTSRIVFPDAKRFRLGQIAKKYKVVYDTEISHRADYDANVLASIWTKQITDLEKMGITNQKVLFDYKDEGLYGKAFSSEVTVIVKNQEGLKELFGLMSISLTDNLQRGGRIFWNDLNKAKNVLIGSSSLRGKLVDLIFTGSKDQIKEEISKYDYIEVQPLQNFKHKIAKGFDIENLKDILKFIITEAKSQGKIVVATGDVRYLNKKHKIYHEIYINSKGLGGARHYLFDYKDPNPVIPDQHLLTTSKMLEEFNFIEDINLLNEIVIENSNKIADQIEEVEIIKKDLYTPTMEGADEKLEKTVYDNAYMKYGNPLPKVVKKRIEREIEPIKKYGFSVIYWISHLLVDKSLKDGYLVGSRGSVGSSLVATLSNITEVNPLDPHYVCGKCKFSEFYTDSKLNSGFDLEDKNCPNCNIPLEKDGQKIPFETFLGFDADKVPDIDLNFSGDYQPIIHNEIKNIFGSEHSFRAGTISTVAERTAFGYVKAWAEETGKVISKAYTEFLAHKVAGTKRTTGQHPGGIIVIPKELTVEDFTPINFPANDKQSAWKTTHFDFHAIHDNVLKLDLLGHDDPTAIKYLEKITGVNAKKDIKFDDKKIISLFSSTKELGIKPDDINGETTGALGIPEFGTTFVRRMLRTAKVNSFGDLISVSGLSHGTNVWSGNAENLVKEDGKTLSEVISCRDNIMTDLISEGIEPSQSFQIMERVRKGRGLTQNQKSVLKDNKIEDWYIDSLEKIEYMFPKAHATAYVMMAWRIAYFKLYHPEAYYAAYFTTRADVFDIISVSKGQTQTNARLKELKAKRNSRQGEPISNKEIALISILEIAGEAFARNVKIGGIDLKKSKAKNWIIDSDNTLIPPFISLDGLGESVAESIIEAREDKDFISIEDLTKRTSINKASVELLRTLGVLEGLTEQNQMSIMDLF